MGPKSHPRRHRSFTWQLQPVALRWAAFLASVEDLLAQAANLSAQRIDLVDGLAQHPRIGLESVGHQFKNPQRLGPAWTRTRTSVGQDRFDNCTQLVRYLTTGE